MQILYVILVFTLFGSGGCYIASLIMDPPEVREKFTWPRLGAALLAITAGICMMVYAPDWVRP